MRNVFTRVAPLQVHKEAIAGATRRQVLSRTASTGTVEIIGVTAAACGTSSQPQGAQGQAGSAAVQWIADLAQRHKAAVPPSQISTRPFTQGKVALKWDIFPTIESVYTASKGQFAFDVAPVPKGPAGRINRNVIGAYGLLAQSKNVALGWDWMKFLSTKEAHLLMANDGAVFPALKEAARSPEFLNPPPPTPSVTRKVFLDSLEQDTLVQDPYIPSFGQIQTLVTRELGPVWEGEKDARNVLQSIAPQVNALLAPK